MFNKMKSFLKDESGQGLVEYSLIVALIAIASIVVMTTMGGNIKNIFSTINNTLKNIAP